MKTYISKVKKNNLDIYIYTNGMTQPVHLSQSIHTVKEANHKWLTGPTSYLKSAAHQSIHPGAVLAISELNLESTSVNILNMLNLEHQKVFLFQCGILLNRCSWRNQLPKKLWMQHVQRRDLIFRWSWGGQTPRSRICSSQLPVVWRGNRWFKRIVAMCESITYDFGCDLNDDVKSIV